MDFLKFLYLEPLQSGNLFGIILGCMMWIISLSFIAYLGYSIFEYADSSLGKVVESKGKVINKEFTEAHTTTRIVYNAATKTPMPVSENVPDEYILEIEFENTSDYIEVDQKDFSKVEVNDIMNIEYSVGFFTRKKYLHSIDI
jgi:hypothetical protein